VRVVVLGGTGRTGRQELVARGHAPVVFARSAVSAPEGAEAVAGDALDPGAVHRALERADAVVSAVSIPRAGPSPFARVTGPADLHSRSAEIVLAAMEEFGVGRLVKVSAQGVGDSAPRAGLGFRLLVRVSNLGPAFADHAVADEVVRRSSVAWTVVRPPVLGDGPPIELDAGEALVTGTFTRVPRAALARWIVRELEGGAFVGRCVTVAPAGAIESERSEVR
jgi:uncharacterized protein YbjT (DUF2867 family)